MAERSNFELKVGIFVFVGLTILMAIVFSIGDLYVIQHGYHVKLHFGFANGLQVGAPVRLAGVEIGRVDSVEVIKTKESPGVIVEIVAWVKREIRVPANSDARVNTLGLLGEKYLELTPPDEAHDFLAPGQVLRGADSLTSTELANRGVQTLERLDELLDAFNDFLDLETRTALKDTVRHSQKAASELHATLSDIRVMLQDVRSGEGTVGRLLYDDALYEELEIVVQDLDMFVKDLKARPWRLLKRDRKSDTKVTEEASTPSRRGQKNEPSKGGFLR